MGPFDTRYEFQPRRQNLIQQAGSTYANGRANLEANMPAPDGLDNERRMLSQMQNGGIYDPNGQYMSAMRQNALTSTVQQQNLLNRQNDQNMKRSYVVDTYRGAQDMGMKAIDNYLGMQRDGANNLAQVAMRSYQPRG